MNIALMIIIVCCFGLLYFLIREKQEIVTIGINQNDPSANLIKGNLHRNLLIRYLTQSPKITLKVYQSLTGLTPEQAFSELEYFAGEGWLHKIGAGAETVYLNFQSPYRAQNIKDTINRG